MTGYMEMAKCNRKQRLLGKSIRRIRMRREHGAEPEVTGNRKPSERDILSGMGAVSARVDS